MLWNPPHCSKLMKFQYSDLLVRDLHTNSCNTLRSSTGSLTLLLHLVCIKVSASLATPLIPPHVLAQVLLPDHPAVHCPLVACALVRESSFGQEKKGKTSRLARQQHCRGDQNPCIRKKKSQSVNTGDWIMFFLLRSQAMDRELSEVLVATLKFLQRSKSKPRLMDIKLNW